MSADVEKWRIRQTLNAQNERTMGQAKGLLVHYMETEEMQQETQPPEFSTNEESAACSHLYRGST